MIRPICKNSLSLCLEFIESGHKTQGVRSLETVVYYAIIFQFYLRPQSNAEKAMAPHSCTLAWRISWTEEPGGLQSMGLLRVRHDWATSLSLSCIGEGNGNPHQRSCLKNPRDWGTWWAAICGVAQSWTGLKRLSSSSSQSNGYRLCLYCKVRCSANGWQLTSSLWKLELGEETVGN